MSSFHNPGTATGPRGVVQASPQLLELLRRDTVSRLVPMLAATLAAVEDQLRRQRQAVPPIDGLDDDLANLSILRNEGIAYEKRWQDLVNAGFASWPQPRSARTSDGFGLVSEDELQTQLVGQPAIEALERRFTDILDVIGSRLWSFAASLGGQSAPSNPLAPRPLVECFLATFPAIECNRTLRQALLRQYERVAGEQLGGFYAWVNTQLSDAGHAMSTASDYAMLMASPLGRIAAPTDTAKAEVWSNENALAPVESSWRGDSRRTADAGPRDALRGNMLRERVHGKRMASAAGTAPRSRRELGVDEFLAVLALLQGEANPVAAPSGDLGGALRRGFDDTAARLGMSNETSAPCDMQEVAIDLICELFDGLVAQHDLSDEALALLARLAPLYLRLALADAYLFDDAEHPAMAVLSLLVEGWDANHRETPQEEELHVLVDRAAQRLVDDFNGDPTLFDQVLSQLQQALESLRKRAELGERRAWQSIQGRERLQAARREADSELRRRLHAQPLLASVAGFLADQWRLSLVHAWLRDGPGSARLAAALTVGDAIVQVDRDAAHANGHAVAQGMIALQQPVCECYVACGLDESGANELLAGLVADLSRPDGERAMRIFQPLAADADTTPSEGGAFDVSGFAIGQVFVLFEPGRPALALRLAGRSELSGTCLLVDRQGMPQRLLAPAEFGSALADGSLVARSACGPVEGQLRRMAQLPG